MRTLILPDVHDRVSQAQAIIQSVAHDQLILLGDFFDDWGTGIEEATATAAQVKVWLNDPKVTCLLGNHDMSYGWSFLNDRFRCSGFTEDKFIAINKLLLDEDWQKFKTHAWLNGDTNPWLVTHAGFHPSFLTGPEVTGRDQIDAQCQEAWNNLNLGVRHPLLGAGFTRWGDQLAGGLCWLDWHDEFQPIQGVNQLVGHTCGKTVRSMVVPGSRNVCLDTDLKDYAVFVDGTMTVHRVGDL